MASNKKVLIFGKTGDGKSTVGNMLVRRSLYPPRNGKLPFMMGDGMDGVTDKCEQASGGGYDVVDTVGLGETDGERKHAVQLITNFLKKTKRMVSYDHILFVKEAGRHDQLDSEIWKVFLDVFKGCEQQFVLVLTKANNPAKWMQENGRHLRERYPQCDGRYVCVTFHPVNSDDQEMEKILEQRRMKSLKNLTLKLKEFSDSNRTGVVPLEYAYMGTRQLRQRSESIWDKIKRMLSYLNRENLFAGLFGRHTKYLMGVQS